MSKTMTLRGVCRHCECAVELAFTPWTGTGPATAPEWACPGCARANLLPAIGSIGWVDRASAGRDGQSVRPVARTH